jgi:hypothetical protein
MEPDRHRVWDHHRVEVEVRWASGPGRLPSDGTAAVGAVDLPSGRQVTPAGFSRPVLWLTDDPIEEPADLYSALRRQFPETGLWPILIHSHDDVSAVLRPDAGTDPESVDVLALLANTYAREMRAEVDQGSGLADIFPATLSRLAPATTGPVDPATGDHLADNRRHMRVVLVPVTRPADIVSALGWQGARTYDGTINYDAGPVTAILRSLEDRFAAVPVVLASDSIELAVQRPPADAETAKLMTAEFFGICGTYLASEGDDVKDFENHCRAPWWHLFWI